MDKGQAYSSREIRRLEKWIDSYVDKRVSIIHDRIVEYFSKFKDEDEQFRKAVDSGEKTDDEYATWRKLHITSGREWSALVKWVGKQCVDIESKIVDEINSRMADVYAQNYNYAMAEMEKQFKEFLNGRQ